MQRKTLEISVGLFILLGLISLVMLAFQVSGLNQVYDSNHGYELKAAFTNVGGLKVRARVTVAGVNVGRVEDIFLDKERYEAVVVLLVGQGIKIPKGSSISILTSGLIGDNYLSIEPGAEDEMMADGDFFEDTEAALVLEKLIGQFLFNSNKND